MLRLLLPVLFLIISSLSVIRAPSNFFWRMQVAVTEFPLVTISASLVLLVTCLWLGKYRTAAIIISSIALILFTVPVARAYVRAGELDTQLRSTFPGSEDAENSLSSPYSFWRMVSGMQYTTVTPFNYPFRSEGTRTWDFDFYPSSSKEKSPCVIVIHSGSWSSGDNKEFPELNSYLANRGYHVAAINYRLAPEFKSPSQIEDVSLLIQQLKARSEELNIDTGNFVLLGRSAGGQVALCAAYTLHDPAIKGVIAYYAPCDMVWGGRITGNPLVLNTNQVFKDYLGGNIDQFPEKYEESSAVHQLHADVPPTLLIHGVNDCMVSVIHSEHLEAALKAQHSTVYFLDLPGATHACDYNLSGPSGQLCTYTVERFLASVTHATATK